MYDIDKKFELAQKVLQENDNIVTDLQVYGRIGVSADYYIDKMKKHQKFEIIHELMNSNQAKASTCVTDGLHDAIKEKKDVRAMELLGKIVDGQICKALRPKEREEEDNRKSRYESMSHDQLVALLENRDGSKEE